MTLSTVQVKQLSADGFQWNQYSDRVGTITNELRYFAPVTYFAFDSWEEAHDFWQSVVGKHCQRGQVRKAERFTTDYEVKLWGINQTTLAKLIERDRQRQPASLPLPPIRRDWSLSESFDAHAVEAA